MNKENDQNEEHPNAQLQTTPPFDIAIRFDTDFPVDLRELHAGLMSRRHFWDWAKEKLSQFVEEQDFVSLTQICVKPKGGRPKTDYHITLDTAKHIAMMEQTPHGFQVRRYFIECEKAFFNMAAAPAPVQAASLPFCPVADLGEKMRAYRIESSASLALYGEMSALRDKLAGKMSTTETRAANRPPIDDEFVRWLLSMVQDMTALGQRRIKHTLRDLLREIPPLPKTVNNRAVALGQRMRKLAQHTYPYDSGHCVRVYPERDRYNRQWVVEVIPNM